jgi:type III pantothenate kinase
MKSAAIDIGNSRVKILSEEHGFAVFPIGELGESWFGELCSYIESHTPPYAWAISSVNSDVEMEVIDFLIEHSSTLTPAEFIISHQTLIDTSHVEGVGSDRIFGLIGALQYAVPPFITVDCGTAITINYLDDNRVFRGGAILAGLSTQLRALEHFTSQLPLLVPQYDDAPFGTTTSQAMNLGTLWGTTGAIKEIIARIVSSAEMQSIPVILTGGDYQLMASTVSEMEVIISPNLVVEGILAAQSHILLTQKPVLE